MKFDSLGLLSQMSLSPFNFDRTSLLFLFNTVVFWISDNTFQVGFWEVSEAGDRQAGEGCIEGKLR